MRNKEYADARLIFDKYHGSHFQMEREGVYTKYKKFEVPKRIERLWLEEEKVSLKNKLAIDQDESEITSLFCQIARIVSQSNDKNGMSYLISFAQNNQLKLDTFSNVMIAEAILNSVSNFDIQYKRAAVFEALKLLKKTSEIKFRVSDSYKENGTLPDYITEDKIIKRIQSDIKYWEMEMKP